MTNLKTGIPIIGLKGEVLTSEVKKVNASEKEATISDGSPKSIINAIANTIDPASINSYPESIFCFRVQISDFKSKSGLYIPTTTKVAGERTGKDGATRSQYRYFITGIGSMVSKCMNNADIAAGDEAFIHAYEDLENIRVPFVVDFEKFYDTGNLDISSYYTFHFSELKGWKIQPVLRAALAKAKPTK